MEKIEKKDKAFEEVILKISPQLKTLSEMYSIPFEKILEVIKQDREMALENYNLFKKMIEEDGDDREATKEGLNKAMELIILSTEKLTTLINSASKLMGDTIKAIVIQNKNEIYSKKLNPQRVQDLRKKIIEGGEDNGEGFDSK